jgi:hypothetical protein
MSEPNFTLRVLRVGPVIKFIIVFALRVSQETESSEVRLMSVLDYNIGLDGSRDREGFLSILSKFGEVLTNGQAKKKGFLGKLFN